ncbi:peptidase S8 [Intrasporangium oryzae NRRL B-24470]|uniref:Peptidase S8 n=2 Tax=Intrasporangium TaxID=53357 RepID=W9GA39_9MICO|nr:S8 family serine peptidase [Intrasporangium oryzae]EWT00739.1 peptidase S8 [Intrasporangium oryzae NRRL B-24470]
MSDHPRPVAGPHRRRGLPVIAGAVALAVGAGVVAPTGGALAADAGTTDSARTQPASPTGERTVTLITGDVVHVTTTAQGQQVLTVDRVNDLQGGYQTQSYGGDTYVIPDEAQAYLASGVLDEHLFNITELLDQGYDDASSPALPIIVEYTSTRQRSAATPPGAKLSRTLPSIRGAALTTPRQSSAAFWDAATPRTQRDGTSAATPSGAGTVAGAVPTTTSFGGGIAHIWLDGKVKADLAEAVPQVKAPQAWAAGFDGTGVKVAVLDTGIDQTHPDLAGKLDEVRSFVPGEGTEDVNGHGTHVASTIAGTGAASSGKLKGVAPGADLLVGKVLSNSGSGLNSWIIAGMEWGAANAPVVSMSLGSQEASDGTDPMALAVNRLTEQTGALFVIAAGNTGAPGTIGSPGAADDALTIGAVDKQDRLAYFSSQGPRIGDRALKPDMVAPGMSIVAARSAQSSGTGFYTSKSGTSMATPMVSGAAAIVVQRHPDWKAPQLKAALMSTADGIGTNAPYQFGTGRLDVAKALGPVRATGSAYLGFTDWPHTGDPEQTRDITYTNSSDQPVDLALQTNVNGPTGPVTDLVHLSASTVTVPANGSATVHVAADPDDVSGVGAFTGTVTATSADGAVSLRTSVGLVKEEERYSLNIHMVGRDGKPAGGFAYVYRYGDDRSSTVPIDPETGMASAQRLLPGKYMVTSWMPVPGAHGPDSAGVALLGTPEMTLGKDTTVTLDARAANLVSVTTPRPSEDSYRRTEWFRSTGDAGQYQTFAASYTSTPAVQDVLAAPVTAPAAGAYEFQTRWRRVAPRLELTAAYDKRVKLDEVYQAGTLRLDGKRTFATVWAGIGDAAAYADLDVKGKAVLVRRSDTVTWRDRAKNAAAAGAALLVIVNDRAGTLYEPTGGVNLPVVSLTKAQGDPVAAAAEAGKLTLESDATEFAPYLYDLVKHYEGRIPEDLSYEPTETELARVDTTFNGTEGLVFELRADCRPWHWPPCIGPTEVVGAPMSRVDWVSTDPATGWYADVQTASGWEQRHDRVSYQPGAHERIDWFAPVTHPRLGPGFWGPRRDGRWMAINVAPSGGGSPLVTGYDDGDVTSRLYQAGTLLRTSKSQSISMTVPATDGTAEYRYEMDTARSAAYGTSLRTKSAWTFRTGQDIGDDWQYLPFLQLGFDVTTDLGNAVKAGPHEIRLTAAHVAGVVGGGTVQGSTLEVSTDDGVTWRPASLRSTGTGAWVAKVDVQAGQWISLRAKAWDDKGNAVNQEVIRAYTVR